MDGRGLETKYYNEAGKCEYKMSVANAWTRLKMSEQDFKKTYNGFTKLVLWGTIVVIAILVILAITLL